MVLLILTTTLWTGCYYPHFKDKVERHKTQPWYWLFSQYHPPPNRASFSWYENVIKPTSGRSWCDDIYHSWDCALWETFPLRKHLSLSLSNLVPPPVFPILEKNPPSSYASQRLRRESFWTLPFPHLTCQVLNIWLQKYFSTPPTYLHLDLHHPDPVFPHLLLKLFQSPSY